MNVRQLFRDYSVDIGTPGSKHYRTGWVNIHCPFCSGSRNYHLGYNERGGYFNCFRCGFKAEVKVIAKVLNLPYREAYNVCKKYQGGRSSTTIAPPVIVKKKAFKLPTNIKDLAVCKAHQLYLKRRGFDWKWLSKMYGIQGTQNASFLDKTDFKFRIIIPIYFEGQLVSWQTRAIGSHPLKYLSCPKTREIVEHKTILYQTPETDSVILCEGVFDVWKVNKAGFPATCCFGIEYTQKQINQLKKYTHITIFFDTEAQAQTQAKKVKRLLDFNGCHTSLAVPLPGEDPGSMTIQQIKEILK